MNKTIAFFPVLLSTSLILVAKEKVKSDRPNILFCLADDAAYKYLSVYGCKWVNTPAFDQVARKGLLFNNAYTCNAKSSPSRSCIITGRNSWQLKEAGNHVPFFPTEFKSFIEVLSENGYSVGYTGKGWAPGEPGKINGITRELTGKNYSDIRLVPPTNSISTCDYVANFSKFLFEKGDKPWFFWYGGMEPHRNYEYGTGVRVGHKKLSDIDAVPDFWPDNDSVRNDMLDYAFEVEYFDNQLQKMLDLLDKTGELENTIVVVTSDNGMPFPRMKGQSYEMSNHLPLAIMWLGGIKKSGRVIDDMVSFSDFAPTFLKLAKISTQKSGMQPTAGKSLTDIMYSTKDNLVNNKRNFALVGRERNDVGRPNDEGYPVRGIVKDGFLLLKNFETDRWPSGNPETGYLDTDGSPTKSVILNQKRQGKYDYYWNMSFQKRSVLELYNIKSDPSCIHNLAGLGEFAKITSDMEKMMIAELLKQQDPRIIADGVVFDNYPYAGSEQNFYNRYMKGEKIKAGWVEDSDFEK